MNASNTMTGYDRRMRSLMNNPRLYPLHATAARRRTAVAAHVALTGTAVVLAVWLFRQEAPWTVLVMPAILLPWCIVTGILNSATGGLFELRARALDERQLAEREQARSAAHKMTGALVGGAALGLWLAAWLTDGQLSRAYVAPLLAGVFVLHWLMPLWIAGLLVKDDPADDFADDAVPSYS
ncbi:hypothetical protein GCM10010329_05160 [Streptomyces spiroverticillatus]|uniref:Uncharacterized protein n=1 Tax=Streptomyces finlayi TaxID=67296 RepID=A0A919C6U4_9ACTN|nr:hypothetical protein [Streptomyces finlayi]GGZ88044.1 hypothetical protein GCM10010329_05160 [Streptomyces spiroverticillatus]GHC79141.1 hypothetical protein GCM10010334_05140 [Streptomyces finlayi]